MSFKAFGKYVEVEPIGDSGLIQLAEGTQDDRCVHRVLSVGSEVTGIEVGNAVFALSTTRFTDRATGVVIWLCDVRNVAAIEPDADTVKPTNAVKILDVGGEPILN